MNIELPSIAGNLKWTTPIPLDAKVPSLEEEVLSAIP